eukprot:365808-Chlamydomonas_euryale.AAC.4
MTSTPEWLVHWNGLYTGMACTLEWLVHWGGLFKRLGRHMNSHDSWSKPHLEQLLDALYDSGCVNPVRRVRQCGGHVRG